MNKEIKESRSPLISVDFWFKMVGAAVLLALGIMGILDISGIGKVLVVFVCGLLIILFELIQVVPAIKVTKSGKARAFITMEIVLDLAIGVFVFYSGVIYALNKGDFNNDTLEGWNNILCGLVANHQIHIILIGIVLYIRGINYFIGTVLFKESTKTKIFWIQVLFMTFGVVCIAAASQMDLFFTWLIIVLSLLSGTYIGGSGGVSFYRYRKSVAERNESEKEDNVEKDTSKRDSIVDDVEEEDEVEIDDNDDQEIEEDDEQEDKPSKKDKKKSKKDKKKNKKAPLVTPEPEVVIPDVDNDQPYVN